jgi:hypothetical protein
MFGSRKAKWTPTRHSADAVGRDAAEQVDVATLINRYLARRQHDSTEAPSPKPKAEPTEGPVATVTPLFWNRDKRSEGVDRQ